MHLIESLVLKLEGNCSSLADVFGNIKEVLNEMIKINDTIPEDSENNITKDMIEFNNDTYLICQDTTQNSVDFWRSVYNGGTFWVHEPEFFKDNQNYKGIEIKFAKYTLEILSIPCSECAVERVFSHLSDHPIQNLKDL